MGELLDRITTGAAKNFRSFGGGSVTAGNPISEAMKDRPAVFAAGVDIREVVEFVVQYIRMPTLDMMIAGAKATRGRDRELADEYTAMIDEILK
jgi:hypothetical protein